MRATWLAIAAGMLLVATAPTAEAGGFVRAGGAGRSGAFGVSVAWGNGGCYYPGGGGHYWAYRQAVRNERIFYKYRGAVVHGPDGNLIRAGSNRAKTLARAGWYGGGGYASGYYPVAIRRVVATTVVGNGATFANTAEIEAYYLSGP